MKMKFYLFMVISMIAISCSKNDEQLSDIYTPKTSKEVSLKNMTEDIIKIQEFAKLNADIFINYSSELKQMDASSAIAFLESKGAVNLISYKETLLKTATDQKEFNYYNNLETNLEVRKENIKIFVENILKNQNKKISQTTTIAVGDDGSAIDWCLINYTLEVAAIIAVDAGTAGTATGPAIIAIGLAAAQYTACCLQRDHPNL